MAVTMATAATITETIETTTETMADVMAGTTTTTTKKTTTITTVANTADCHTTAMIAGHSRKTKTVDPAGGETSANDMARRRLRWCRDGSGRRLH